MDLRRTHERRAVHTEARSRPFQRRWHASSGEPVFESTEPRAAPRPEPPALGKCVSSSSGSRLPLHASAPYTSAHGAPQRPERTSADTRVSRQTRPARSQDTRSVHALVLIGRRSSAPPRALARRGVSREPRHVTHSSHVSPGGGAGQRAWQPYRFAFPFGRNSSYETHCATGPHTRAAGRRGQHPIRRETARA